MEDFILKKSITFILISLLFILLFGCFPNVSTGNKLEVPIWLLGTWEDPLTKVSYTFTLDNIVVKPESGAEIEVKVLIDEALKNNPGSRIEQYHTLTEYSFEVVKGTGTSKTNLIFRNFYILRNGVLNHRYYKKFL